MRACRGVQRRSTLREKTMKSALSVSVCMEIIPNPRDISPLVVLLIAPTSAFELGLTLHSCLFFATWPRARKFPSSCVPSSSSSDAFFRRQRAGQAESPFGVSLEWSTLDSASAALPLHLHLLTGPTHFLRLHRRMKMDDAGEAVKKPSNFMAIYVMNNSKHYFLDFILKFIRKWL